MRYHYEKPEIYLSMYGKRYLCNHPVYDSCTLFEIGEKGLAVIQQRYDPETKNTFWSLSYRYNTANYVGTEDEAAPKAKMGNGLRSARNLAPNSQVLLWIPIPT